MTVIVWDGKTLAADTNAFGQNSGLVDSVTKIIKLKDGSLLGASGDLSEATAFMAWMRNPKLKKPKFENTTALHIKTNKEIWTYESSFYPFKINQLQYTIGSGNAVARGALYMGASAVQAVQAAIACLNTCGGNIDVLTLGR